MQVTLSASLRISGKDLNPLLVTKALDHTPSSFTRAGEVLRSRGNQNLLTHTGVSFGTIWQENFLSQQTIVYPECNVLDYIHKLAGVDGIEAVDLSFFLNGEFNSAIDFFCKNSEVLSRFLSDHAQFGVGTARVETDFKEGTTGNCWIIHPGQDIKLSVQWIDGRAFWQETISAYKR